MRNSLKTLLAALLLLLPWTPACGEDALVAVAANFTEVVRQLEGDFERSSGHKLTVSTGSTGKLYAQIKGGAPFDVLLAADQRRPELLEQEGNAVAGSRFTYAVGQLTLWSPDPERLQADGTQVLQAGDFRALAIANPDLAPYGLAAKQTLTALGLFDQLSDRIVMGENIGQTYALVATGNAELGFVALSSVLKPGEPSEGSRWYVPTGLYEPIRQDAVLLTRAATNEAAKAFLDYLRSDAAHALIRQYGYGVE